MNEQEAIEAIKEICQDADPEHEHLASEEILLRFLKENGFEELSATYEDVSENFWYT